MSQHCCCSMAMAQVKAFYLIPGPQYPSQDGMGMETHCICGSPHCREGRFAKFIAYEPIACNESVSGPNSIANQ